jgi:phosphatidylserine decarboxylase
MGGGSLPFCIARNEAVMRLPFMPETWSMVLPTLGIGLALSIWGFCTQRTVAAVLGVLVLVVAALMLNFFRDFERSLPTGLGPKTVVSPADGHVVLVRIVREDMHLKEEALQVAIFMNPLDNHVQRVPFSGTVVEKTYYPGEYLAAYNDKADLVNEQSHLVVQLDAPKGVTVSPGRIVLKQIAGMLCHRVRTDASEGQHLVQGDRFGRILLGSRVDVFLPKGFQPQVKVGDKVCAGQTVLGELP